MFSLDSSLNEQSLPVIKWNVNYHTSPCMSIFLKYFFVMLNIKINISGHTICIFYLKTVERALFATHKYH